METKFTPGPWAREKDCIVGERYICTLFDWHITGAGSSYPEINAALTAERDANARLIAAAPELLIAAVAAYGTITRRLPEMADGSIVHDLRAAIAKATGR